MLKRHLGGVKYFKDDVFVKKFGNRVRELRKKLDISQEELSYRTGFELSQIGRIERGTINTSISHVAAIAKALNIAPKDLFSFD